MGDEYVVVLVIVQDGSEEIMFDILKILYLFNFLYTFLYQTLRH